MMFHCKEGFEQGNEKMPTSQKKALHQTLPLLVQIDRGYRHNKEPKGNVIFLELA